MESALDRHPNLPAPVASMSSKLNWLRAGVLGANDGIVSTAALMVGVAAASTSSAAVFTAGIAGLVAGAFSMAVGEYVSVSSQRDSERAAIVREQGLLEADPVGQEAQLAHMYEERGVTPQTAALVAKELTAKNVLRAHLDVEYRIDAEELVSPWAAALASAASFTLGSLIPIVAATLLPNAWIPWSIMVAATVALILTGLISARIGGAGRRKAMVRVVIGGMLALAATHVIGSLLGVAIA